MTGMSVDDYQADDGLRRAVDPRAGARSRTGADDGPHHRGNRHQPHAGHRRGDRPRQTGEAYWQPLFAGYEWTKAWAARRTRTWSILVYNDHASAFSLEVVPTFASAAPTAFAPADEGYGPRPVPVVRGNADLAWHIRAVADPGRVRPHASMQPLDVDHGLTVPLSLIFGQPESWPVRVIPLAVNVIQYPPPTGQPLLRARRGDPPGRAELSRGPHGPGLGHRRHEPPAAGPACRASSTKFDNAFFDRLIGDPAGLRAIAHIEYMREAGSEGIELVMWLIMRGATRPGTSTELHRFYHVPASNTAVGHLGARTRKPVHGTSETGRPTVRIALAGRWRVRPQAPRRASPRSTTSTVTCVVSRRWSRPGGRAREYGVDRRRRTSTRCSLATMWTR